MESKKIDQWIKIGIGVLMGVLAWVIISTLQEPKIVEGSEAPKFAVKADNGATLTPTDFGGKLLLLNFWASWCAPCVEEAPSLNEFAKTFKNAGVVVLGVSVDRKEPLYENFVKRFNVSYPTARDPEENLSYRYGTYKIPESYIIDRNGKVVRKYAGLPERDGQAISWMDPELVG